MNLVNSSPSRQSSWRRGFTLFEIVVVMALAAVLGGIGAYYLAAPRLQEELRTEHAKIEDLVLQARTLAVSYQQPFIVRFKEGRVQMEPQARPEVDSYDEDANSDEARSNNLRSLGSQSWPREEKIEGEWLVEVRRWGKNDFKVITERSEEVWVFDPNGLCEPIAVRISKDEGTNSLTRAYHPLTGLAEDESLSLAGN